MVRQRAGTAGNGNPAGGASTNDLIRAGLTQLGGRSADNGAVARWLLETHGITVPLDTISRIKSRMSAGTPALGPGGRPRGRPAGSTTAAGTAPGMGSMGTTGRTAAPIAGPVPTPGDYAGAARVALHLGEEGFREFGVACNQGLVTVP